MKNVSKLIAPDRYEIETFKVGLAVETTPHDIEGVPAPSVDALVRAIYATLEPDQEHFVVLFLNTFARVSGYRVIASGGYGQVSAPPSRILRDALLAGAHGIILVHNHPNGNEHPSPSDMTAIQRVVVAAGALEVPVADVMVLAQGTGKIYSFADNGTLRQLMTRDALFRMLRPHMGMISMRDDSELVEREAY